MSKKLSIILYQDGDKPKYFELNKTQMKTLLVGLPLITALSLGLLILGALSLKTLRVQAERKEPAIIQDLRTQLTDLQKSSEDVFKLNEELVEKLGQSSGDISGSPLPLTLFRVTPGQQDLSQTPTLNVEDFEFNIQQEEIQIKFNLVNQDPDGPRQTGTIFIIMMTGNTYTFYPQDALSADETKLVFNKGEFFSASRFRPVEARMVLPPRIGPALFKVLIFSRTGDLVTKKIFTGNLTRS